VIADTIDAGCVGNNPKGGYIADRKYPRCRTLTASIRIKYVDRVTAQFRAYVV
jgi:hypothetical protein